ncbi:MAG: MBL fold metallo-hydrolase [Vicinamibacterales bacterium]
MSTSWTSLTVAAAMAVSIGFPLTAQVPTQDTHLQAARDAARDDFTDLFDTTCGLIRPALIVNTTPAPPTVAADRASWHAEPARVFDNLYYVGQSEYSAWALTTSEGIIVFDAIFDYSVRDEVVEGLTKLGLDPKTVRYVVISHGHGDHVGGAKALQDLGAQIVMSAADWDLLERARVTFPKPTRDIVATDGQMLTLGDTTITLHITPGHTLGTVSSLIPVKDGGTTHMAAYWGGTAFNWVRGPANYVTPERPASFWFDTYAQSAARFSEFAARRNADVLLSNHTRYDRTWPKVQALATRAPGAPHPFVVGTPAVRRFLSVAESCARAGSAVP